MQTQISTKREVGKKSGSTCLVPVGNGAIKEEPLFYDLDGMLFFDIRIHKWKEKIIHLIWVIRNGGKC